MGANNKAGDIEVADEKDENFSTAGTGLYVMDEDDGKYTGKAYVGQDRYSVVEATLTQDVTSSSVALRFEKTNANTGVNEDDEILTEEISRLYLDDTTFFVAVEDKAADLDVKTATGVKTISKDTQGLKVYAIYKDGNDDAVFVIYVADKMTNSVNKDDVVYLTGDAKTSNKDGYIVDLYYMADMNLEESVVIDKDGEKAQGYSPS